MLEQIINYMKEHKGYDDTLYNEYLSREETGYFCHKSMYIIENPLINSDEVNLFVDLNEIRDFDDEIKGYNMITNMIDTIICKRDILIDNITRETHPENKKQKIYEYFNYVKGLELQKNSFIFDELAIFGNTTIISDSTIISGLYYFDKYDEIINHYGIEESYVLFSNWRLLKTIDSYKLFLNSIEKYFVEYLFMYQHSPMCPDLYKPIDNYELVEKHILLASRFLIINELANQVFSKFKKKGWIINDNNLFENYKHTRNNASFDIFFNKILNPKEKNEIIADQVMAKNGYISLIKSLDILTLLSEGLLILLKDKNLLQSYTNKLRCHDIEKGYRMTLINKDELFNLLFLDKNIYNISKENFNIDNICKSEELIKNFSSSLTDGLILTNSIISNDIDSIVNDKQKFMKKISDFLPKKQEELLDGYIDKITKKIKELIQNQPDYNYYYSKISKDFHKYIKYLFSYPDILSTLSTAEYLYDRYIIKKEEIDNFDYSCVSIMYYMALEDFINKIIYIPYKNEVLIPNIKDILTNKKYLSNPKSYMNKNMTFFKDSCELGSLSYLLKDIKKTPKLSEYLNQNFSLSSTSTSQIIKFGVDLGKIAKKRNLAAHGGNYIMYNEAKSTKESIFEEIEGNEFRGMLKRFLELIFPNNSK